MVFGRKSVLSDSLALPHAWLYILGHVQVNITSPESLFVGLTHRRVTFSAQISMVNPKTLQI